VEALLVLTFVVFIHELGHFLAARSQGIKVENFSVGFGPELLRWPPKPPKQFDEAGNEVKPEKEEGVVYSLRAIPLGGYVAFPRNYKEGEEKDKDGFPEIIDLDDPDLLQNRPKRQRALVYAAGVIANVMLAYACIFSTVSTKGLQQPVYEPGVYVTQVNSAQTPAALAGIKEGDVLLSINGYRLPAKESSLQEFIMAVRESKGAPLEIDIAREGKTLKSIAQATQPEGNLVGAPYSIGILLKGNIVRFESVKAQNPLEAASLSARETGKLMEKTFDGFTSLLKSRSAANLQGPLGVVQAGAQVAEADTFALLQFAAVISVNLAVVNSFPIPALDGGQMAFLALEAARGKKNNRELEESINGYFFLVLFLLSGSALFGDVERFFFKR